MKTVKYIIFFVIALVIYVIVFNAVNPEAFFSLLKGKATAEKISGDTTNKYIGYKSGEDMKRLTSSKEIDTAQGQYMTVDATKASPLGLYKIKNKQDMEDLKYTRNAKGRKIYDPSKKIHEYVYDPGSYKAYYNSYYLIGLQDGTYIVAYLDDIYGKKIEDGKAVTLPVGRLEKMSSTVRAQVKDIKDKNINQTVILNCFNEQDFKKHENMYVILRGGSALAAIFILYGLICLIFPSAKLWHE